MAFFDPDRKIFALDKAQHAGFGLGAALALLALGFGPLWTMFIVIAVGGAFELGQWDIARHHYTRFPAGYGFGLLDLAADTLGAAIPVALYCYLSFTPLPSHPRRRSLPDRIAIASISPDNARGSTASYSDVPSRPVDVPAKSLSPRSPNSTDGAPLARVQ